MPARPALSLVLAAALALSQGCVGSPAAGPGTRGATKPAAGSKAPLRSSPRPGVKVDRPPGTPRLVDFGVPTQLTGKVKVLSDWGVGIIANNGSGVIADGGARVLSNNGGGIVANNGGGIVANNGGGMIGKTKFYGLAQAREAPPEDLLADAQIEVLDAQGRVLVDADGQPIVAFSDPAGNYVLEADLPPENLILRVRLFAGGELRGGELTALVASREGGAQAVPLDTASSLGASYVLSAFVAGRQERLDRLPRGERDALQAGLEQARAALPLAVPAYDRAALAASVATLRAADAPLDETLERIEALMLAGQSNLGEGLAATRVPLSAPLGLARDEAGHLYVGESVAGRIRKITPDGTLTLFAGAGTAPGRREQPDAFQALFTYLSDVVAMPGGGLLAVEGEACQVRRIWPDGRVTVVAGSGKAGRDAPGGPAAAAAIFKPVCAAVAPDGTIAIGENVSAEAGGRLLTVDASGTLGELALPPQAGTGRQITGLAYAPDGTLYVATGIGRRLFARQPDGAWRLLADELDLHDPSRIALAPGGGVYVSETRAHRVVLVAADGTKSVIAGSGEGGYAGDGGPPAQARLNRPAGLLPLPDGRLLIVDSGNMVVRVMTPGDLAQPIATFAGTEGVIQQGEGTAIAVNSPAGLALDPQGRIVLAEIGGSTLKRLAGSRLELLAGTATGHQDGPALTAAFNTPGGMVYGPDGSLWVLDTVQPRLRRLRPDGMVETAAGSGKQGAEASPYTSRRLAAGSLDLGRPLFVTVGPDGRPYWTDNFHNVVCRLSADGFVEVVAGGLAEGGKPAAGAHQDGPATDARFNLPAGLVFDAQGDLYVADTANFCIRRISGATGPDPVVSTVAGVVGLAALATLDATGAGQPDGVAGAEAAIFLPVSLALDDRGRLYVGEAGTARLNALANLPLLDDLPVVTPARVRRIDLAAPGHPVSTVVGPGSRVLAAPYGDQALGLPLGLVIDRAGGLVLADSLNNQLKLVPRQAL